MLLPRTLIALRVGLAVLTVVVSGRAVAELLQFEGRILASLPGLGELEVASGLGVAEINGLQLESVEIISASIAGSLGVPVTDPTSFPLTSIRISASIRSGRLGIDPFAPPFGEPAITSNSIAMQGEIRICLLVPTLPPCVGGFGIPLTKGNGSVGVGIGGLLTVGGAGALRISLYGAPFTLNTASVTGATANGAVVTIFSAGSIGGPSLFTSTAGQPGGLLSVVTPFRTVTGEGGGSNRLIPGFFRFEIVFLPEPRVGLLLAVGGSALLTLGRAGRRAAHDPSPRRK